MFICGFIVLRHSAKIDENASCSYPGIVRGRTTAEYELWKDKKEDIVQSSHPQLTSCCSSKIGGRYKKVQEGGECGRDMYRGEECVGRRLVVMDVLGKKTERSKRR